MSGIGMGHQSEEERQAFEQEAFRLVEQANLQGLTLRLLGSLAFYLHCPRYGHLQRKLGRRYTDIDLAGYSREAARIPRFFAELGYREEAEVNVLFAGQRMIFHHPGRPLHVDVFFDRLDFCHVIPWEGRLEVDSPTIPLAEMLLEKLQIVQINEKDIVDTCMLLLEHPLADHDNDAIHVGRVARLCAQDWGLWRTVTFNLEKVVQMVQTYEQLSSEERARVVEQVQTLRERLDREPKDLRWRLRDRVGTRVKWYRDVDDL
ncbi:MAG: hypothetical protein ACP5SI_01115 [Chloroflexia bacterium]